MSVDNPLEHPPHALNGKRHIWMAQETVWKCFKVPPLSFVMRGEAPLYPLSYASCKFGYTFKPILAMSFKYSCIICNVCFSSILHIRCNSKSSLNSTPYAKDIIMLLTASSIVSIPLVCKTRKIVSLIFFLCFV